MHMRAWLLEALQFYMPMGFFRQAPDPVALAEELIEPLFGDSPFDPYDPVQDLYLLSFDRSRALCDQICFGEALAPGNDAYVGVLEALAKISRGHFTPKDIREEWLGRDGPIKLTFNFRGQDRTVQVGMWEGFFDFRILLQLNHMLRESLYRFEMVPLDDMLFVCVLKADEKLNMERLRGLTFMVLDLSRMFRPLSQLMREMALPEEDETVTYFGTLNEMSDRCVGRLMLELIGEDVEGGLVYDGEAHQEDLGFIGRLDPATGFFKGTIEGQIRAAGKARPYCGQWEGHLVPGNRVITGTWKGWFKDEQEIVYEGQLAAIEKGMLSSRDPHLERVAEWLKQVWTCRNAVDYPWILPCD